MNDQLNAHALLFTHNTNIDRFLVSDVKMHVHRSSPLSHTYNTGSS